MKKETVRTSFDLSKATIEQADAIAYEAKLASRKDAVEWSIAIASQITEAIKQGFKVLLTKSETEPKEFEIGRANIPRQSAERMLLIELRKEDSARLLEVMAQPNHPASKAALILAHAVFQPNPQPVEAKVLFELIYWALRLADEKFLNLVRDIITNFVCSFDSFHDLLEAEHFTPQFDLNNIEQQFLLDEYLKAKHRQMIT